MLAYKFQMICDRPEWEIPNPKTTQSVKVWPTPASDIKYFVKIEQERDNLLTEVGKEFLQGRYSLDEAANYQKIFARVSSYFADDEEHAQRLYEYMSQLWFMPSTPVLSNGGLQKGLPIACFVNEAADTLESWLEVFTEDAYITRFGGGVGTCLSNIRALGRPIRSAIGGSATGIMPLACLIDYLIKAVTQGNTRKGAAAAYLKIDHPEILEFMDLRTNTGDLNRRGSNIHQGVLITNAFMEAVVSGKDYDLINPEDKTIAGQISAREIWMKLLLRRSEFGEPYMLFYEHVNNQKNIVHKKLNLDITMSNLCAEILLPTGLDHLNRARTGVCCLSSLNLARYAEWKDSKEFIPDIMRFLDNVLQDFINRAPSKLDAARYSAYRERSLGIGMMGLHTLFMKNNIIFGSEASRVLQNDIFQNIKNQIDFWNVEFGKQYGSCPDARDANIIQRHVNVTALAPTASISLICGSVSPGADPLTAVAYSHKGLTRPLPIYDAIFRELLQKKGQDTDEVWNDILIRQGSVQHLEFLSAHEKAVFRTAYEINQADLIELAALRNKFIDQGMSTNLFFYSDVSKKELHGIHMLAWQKGLRTLYYTRSTIRDHRATVDAKYIKL
jgi:ribonucleoside-diphosphate reductase alpha chain